ncbi:hypothetical protein [Legionella bozemanae]|uniref:hypothetical protein n=1 Tax=Legionella bozemanae TaxID=447 RepID=UPI0010415A92|nr:hypothetical protein [Legionella bozemanae]
MSYKKMGREGLKGGAQAFKEKTGKLAQKQKEKEEVLYEDDIVQAKKIAGGIHGNTIEAIGTQIESHRKGKEKYPDSVLAVYDLVKALDSFEGEISAKNEQARQLMSQQLTGQLQRFLEALEPSTFTKSRDFKPEKQEHLAARDTFQRNCTTVMENNYKNLASETSLWNWIKDKFNAVCKALTLSPKGKLIDSTLDSSEIIKQQRIKDSFAAVKNTGQIEIADEEDIDTKLSGPNM